MKNMNCLPRLNIPNIPSIKLLTETSLSYDKQQINLLLTSADGFITHNPA
jgi:hypothetical protein